MKPIVLKNVSKKYYKQEKKTFKELIPALFSGERGGEFLWALKDVSFEVEQGETVGIVGRNGSGKSTLLKLVAGVTKPTEGKIETYGKISPLIELGAGFHPELTGRENIYLNASILGISKKKVDKRVDKIIEFAELEEFIDSPVKNYSSGMYTRLGFSVAINVEPEILLIDEILAVGDTAFQKKCLRKMNDFKKRGVTFLFVSHSMSMLEDFCDRVVFLKSGQQVAIGKPREIIKKYQESLNL